MGDIIPIFVDSDILPGDTVQMDMAELVRMATPIYPIMDNLYMDIYWFFVPHRLVWDNWPKFWGENDEPWTQETEYEIPQITAPQNGWNEGTIADYMGVPTKVGNLSINALPFRAYCKIWNDWFRDENLKSNCHIYKDETTRTGTNTGDYVLNAEFGAMPLKAAKMHDYFTSALPEPQKGDPVNLPLGGTAELSGGTATTTANGLLKVGTQSNTHTYGNGGLKFNNNQTIASQTGYLFGVQNISNYNSNTLDARKVTQFTTPNISQSTTIIEPTLLSTSGELKPNNLYANPTDATYTTTLNGLTLDLSTATAATISMLRTAFAVQRYLENAGLHGTRYIEYIRSVFGVTSSDARMQRAEYLGGERVPINIDQIIQTSSTDATSPQGNTAGFSCTINRDSMFTKSFEEHGTLMGLIVIRTEHTYQQGLKKMWTRRKWTDFYNPFFATLSEQPVYNENIYAQGTSVDKEAFGYQEAWADYRYKENYVSGYMRSNATGSLDVWHFADEYNQLPTLSSAWIDEPYENVDRTIAVTSQLTHQFIGDFFFKCYYTRPMPVYSIPGLERL